jgi:hypothetical protein
MRGKSKPSLKAPSTINASQMYKQRTCAQKQTAAAPGLTEWKGLSADRTCSVAREV